MRLCDLLISLSDADAADSRCSADARSRCILSTFADRSMWCASLSDRRCRNSSISLEAPCALFVCAVSADDRRSSSPRIRLSTSARALSAASARDSYSARDASSCWIFAKSSLRRDFACLARSRSRCAASSTASCIAFSASSARTRASWISLTSCVLSLSQSPCFSACCSLSSLFSTSAACDASSRSLCTRPSSFSRASSRDKSSSRCRRIRFTSSSARAILSVADSNCASSVCRCTVASETTRWWLRACRSLSTSASSFCERTSSTSARVAFSFARRSTPSFNAARSLCSTASSPLADACCSSSIRAISSRTSFALRCSISLTMVRCSAFSWSDSTLNSSKSRLNLNADVRYCSFSRSSCSSRCLCGISSSSLICIRTTSISCGVMTRFFNSSISRNRTSSS
eukprot:Opistho-2@53405